MVLGILIIADLPVALVARRVGTYCIGWHSFRHSLKAFPINACKRAELTYRYESLGSVRAINDSVDEATQFPQ